MSIFKYKAFAQDKTLQSGLVEANNRDYVEEILKEKGLAIVTISEMAAAKKFNLSFLNRVKGKDIVIFSRQFSVLV